MDRILIILKKENGPRASSAPCTGVKYHNIQTCLLVYAADLGERLQDHWSSGVGFPKRWLNYKCATFLYEKNCTLDNKFLMDDDNLILISA